LRGRFGGRVFFGPKNNPGEVHPMLKGGGGGGGTQPRIPGSEYPRTNRWEIEAGPKFFFTGPAEGVPPPYLREVRPGFGQKAFSRPKGGGPFELRGGLCARPGKSRIGGRGGGKGWGVVTISYSRSPNFFKTKKFVQEPENRGTTF